MDSYLEHLKYFYLNLVPFHAWLGMEVDVLEKDFCRVRLPFRDEFVGDPRRPALHGGVLATLADGCAGLTTMAALTQGDRCSTTDLRMDYFSPARPEDLFAEGTIRHQGKRVVTCQVSVFHEDREELAHGLAVFSVLPKERVKA